VNDLFFLLACCLLDPAGWCPVDDVLNHVCAPDPYGGTWSVWSALRLMSFRAVSIWRLSLCQETSTGHC